MFIVPIMDLLVRRRPQAPDPRIERLLREVRSLKADVDRLLEPDSHRRTRRR